ncbi:ATP-binding protein [Ruminococcus flavefaciens]|uniref:ATP-binding protein n=1 Tax=Ruminococcus flavefaciens TaxID=1265 RepID=UPI0026EC20A7|nr:ATP-binding protein [Ruminococcus flavefaciens]
MGQILYQASAQRQGRFGLGLAIVKQIVSQHNGVCKADSEVGAGSIFSIELKAE